MVRVLIVDDQALVRRGFRMILAAEPDLTVVGEAATRLEAVEEAARLHPDVVLMDIRMPGLDGVTHDPAAAAYADRVLFLADGRVVGELEDPTAETVLARMIGLGA